MPFLPTCLGEGSPTKIDYRKKGTLILTSLLEDLDWTKEFNEDANLEKAPKEVALEKSIASPQVQSTEREKRIDSPSGFALEEVQLDKEYLGEGTTACDCSSGSM